MRIFARKWAKRYGRTGKHTSTRPTPTPTPTNHYKVSGKFVPSRSKRDYGKRICFFLGGLVRCGCHSIDQQLSETAGPLARRCVSVRHGCLQLQSFLCLGPGVPNWGYDGQAKTSLLPVDRPCAVGPQSLGPWNGPWFVKAKWYWHFSFRSIQDSCIREELPANPACLSTLLQEEATEDRARLAGGLICPCSLPVCQQAFARRVLAPAVLPSDASCRQTDGGLIPCAAISRLHLPR